MCTFDSSYTMTRFKKRSFPVHLRLDHATITYHHACLQRCWLVAVSIWDISVRTGALGNRRRALAKCMSSRPSQTQRPRRDGHDVHCCRAQPCSEEQWCSALS